MATRRDKAISLTVGVLSAIAGIAFLAIGRWRPAR